MERILIAGAGNMGSWLAETLCLDYDVAVYDTDPQKLKYLFNTFRYKNLSEAADFSPDLLLNTTGLKQTIEAYEHILPFISDNNA
ncbi:MAG TPA: hypothetical protein DEQ09_10095 [Bacteroidales bacterium]|nr:hypothetical protein [Bacteroidales bacterium]